jgi:hypothetical protein
MNTSDTAVLGNTNPDRIRELADSLDFLTEADLQVITGWTDSTCAEYRKRRKGPPWVRFGQTVLYPRLETREYLRSRIQQPTLDIKGVL